MKLITNVNGHKLITNKTASGAQVTTVYKNGQVKYVCDLIQDAYEYTVRRNK